MQRKKNYIFVGSFVIPPGGMLGGVQHCSRSLVNSELSQYINWTLIDTTQKSLPRPNVFLSTLYACKRILLMLKHLICDKVDGVLIFASFGTTSLLEKGVLCFLAKIFRKRVILSIHSNIKLELITPYRPLAFLSRWYATSVFKTCDLVILSNQLAAEAAEELFRVERRKIKIIPNWIDPQPFLKPVESATHVESNQEKSITLLFVGTLIKTKGVYELIDAFHLLAQKQPQVRLLICGGGPEQESLEEKCREYNLQDRVEFCGWVSGQRKIELFHAADLFVLPSYTEGLPISLLETMATGMPAVVTPVGGIPTLIKDGENGSVVPTHKVEPLAEAIEDLMQQPELMNQMGQRNREYVVQHHNLDSLWQDFAEAFGIEVKEAAHSTN